MDQAQKLRNIIRSSDHAQKLSARVITITSGKGGVGKSNIAVNLAVELQRMGKKVIIFDADFGLANIEIIFGSVPKYNIGDMLYKGKKIEDVITKGPMDIEFISGGSGLAKLNNLNKNQTAFLINSFSMLDTLADVILVDTGAGIADTVLDFVVSSPEVILVATPDPSSMTDAYSLVKALHVKPEFNKDDTKLYVVANKVQSADDAKAVFQRLHSVVGKFLEGSLHYLGMIPWDDAVEGLTRRQELITIAMPNAPSAEAFSVLADNLMTGQSNDYVRKRGIREIFNGFFSHKMKEDGIWQLR